MSREDRSNGVGRPRSQPRRVGSAGPGPRGGAASAVAAPDPQMLSELKISANGIELENKMMRTRLMALEKELVRREKLLRQLVLSTQAGGSGIGSDLIERLREERNLLPIFKKRLLDVNAQIDEKEAEIKELKRDPNFTRIIELQVEFASWQHEAKRLQSLIQKPSPESNPAAAREVEVHERRAQKLERDLESAETRRASLVEELRDAAADHKASEDDYKARESELINLQESTRQKASSLSSLLLKRKDVEKWQSEIDAMNLNCRHYDEELESLNAYALPGTATDAATTSPSKRLGRRVVSRRALYDPPLPPWTPSGASSLLLARSSGACRAGITSLPACLIAADKDCDGLLDCAELQRALLQCGCSAISDTQKLNELVDAVTGSVEGSSIRWLDFLVYLDRLGTGLCQPGTLLSPPRSLPSVRPFRIGCLRASVSAEALKERLMAVASASDMKSLVGDLGLEDGEQLAWVETWEALGTEGLLLRLPLSEVAPAAACLNSWRRRCEDAVRCHWQELDMSFGEWRPRGMLLSQFRKVCTDVFGVELAEDDIEDLAAFASIRCGDEDMVDGARVLRLAD